MSEETDDVVRLLTIHGAKGLEFPIVALANLATSRGGPGPSPMTDGEPGQIHVRVGSKGSGFDTPEFAARAEQEEIFEAAERLRLLYVGVTRARDVLLVPDMGGRLTEFLSGDAAAGLGTIGSDELGSIDAALADGPAHSVTEAELEAALAAREDWAATRAATITAASRGLEVRPASAEIEHGDPTGPLLGADDEPIIAGAGGPPKEIGDALHKVMELVDLDADTDAVARVARAVASTAGLPESAGEIAELAAACLATPVMARARAAPEAWREIPFERAADFGYAVGRADLVFREASGQVVVVDFKTDRVGPASAAAAAEAHAPQLSAYRAAVGGEAEVVLVFARARTEVVLEGA